MMGAMFFNEFAGLKAYELVFFVLAILITMFGVGVMAFNIGRYLAKVDDFVMMVAFENVTDEVGVVRVAFPVWGGYLGEAFQEYYLKKDAFFVNVLVEKVGEELKESADVVADAVEHAVEFVDQETATND